MAKWNEDERIYYLNDEDFKILNSGYSILDTIRTTGNNRICLKISKSPDGNIKFQKVNRNGNNVEILHEQVK